MTGKSLAKKYDVPQNLHALLVEKITKKNNYVETLTIVLNSCKNGKDLSQNTVVKVWGNHMDLTLLNSILKNVGVLLLVHLDLANIRLKALKLCKFSLRKA